MTGSLGLASLGCDSAVLVWSTKTRAHTKGHIMQPHALLSRVLRRFFEGSAFLEGFLEGTL